MADARLAAVVRHIRHLAGLAQLESRHGLKLRTVGDRLRERFIAPLAIDRMCALVGPAWLTRNESIAGISHIN